VRPAPWPRSPPNIVTIHSVDEVDGRLFLTMELVDGQPLSELIRPGGLPLAQLLAIGTPLADAVSAAHARGITHRDLKPANVMVTPTRSEGARLRAGQAARGVWTTAAVGESARQAPPAALTARPPAGPVPLGDGTTYGIHRA